LISCEAAISQAQSTTKTGFRNSDGWTLAKPALAEIGAEERQHQQGCEDRREAQDREPAHQVGRHHRGQHHGGERDATEQHLPLDVVERVEPVALGQRHRSREAE
jgi:hypothetical protein